MGTRGDSCSQFPSHCNCLISDALHNSIGTTPQHSILRSNRFVICPLYRMLSNTGPVALQSSPFFDLVLFADGSCGVVGRNEVPAVVNSNLRHCRDDPQRGPTMEFKFISTSINCLRRRKRSSVKEQACCSGFKRVRR